MVGYWMNGGYDIVAGWDIGGGWNIVDGWDIVGRILCFGGDAWIGGCFFTSFF